MDVSGSQRNQQPRNFEDILKPEQEDSGKTGSCCGDILIKYENDEISLIAKADAHRSLWKRVKTWWEKDKYNLNDINLQKKLKTKVEDIAKSLIHSEDDAKKIQKKYDTLVNDLVEKKMTRRWYEFTWWKSEADIKKRISDFRNNVAAKFEFNPQGSIDQQRDSQQLLSDAAKTGATTNKVATVVLQLSSSFVPAVLQQTTSTTLLTIDSQQSDSSQFSAQKKTEEPLASLSTATSTGSSTIDQTIPTTASDQARTPPSLESLSTTINKQPQLQQQVEQTPEESSEDVIPPVTSQPLSPESGSASASEKLLLSVPPQQQAPNLTSSVLAPKTKTPELPKDAVPFDKSDLSSKALTQKQLSGQDVDKVLPKIPTSALSGSPVVSENEGQPVNAPTVQEARTLFESYGELSDTLQGRRKEIQQDKVQEIDVGLPKNLESVRAQFGVAQGIYEQFSAEIRPSFFTAAKKAFDELQKKKDAIEKLPTVLGSESEWQIQLKAFYTALDTCKVMELQAQFKESYEPLIKQSRKDLKFLKNISQEKDFFSGLQPRKITQAVSVYKSVLDEFDGQIQKQLMKENLPKSVEDLKKKIKDLDDKFKVLNEKITRSVSQMRQVLVEKRYQIEEAAEKLREGYRNTRYRPTIDVPQLSNTLSCQDMVEVVGLLKNKQEIIDQYPKILDEIEGRYNAFFKKLDVAQRNVNLQLIDVRKSGEVIQERSVTEVEKTFLEQLKKLYSLTRLRFANNVPEDVSFPERPERLFDNFYIEDEERLRCILEVLQDEQVVNKKGVVSEVGEEPPKSIGELLDDAAKIEFELPPNERSRVKKDYDALEIARQKLRQHIGDILSRVDDAVNEKLQQKYLRSLAKMCEEEYTDEENQTNAELYFKDKYIEEIQKTLAAETRSFATIVQLEKEFKGKIETIRKAVGQAREEFRLKLPSDSEVGDEALDGMSIEYGILSPDGQIEIDWKRYYADLGKSIAEAEQENDT